MFKSVTIYQLTQPFDTVLEKISKSLSKKKFTPCGDHDDKSVGWIFAGDKKYIGETNHCSIICLRTDTKTVPAGYIKDQLAEHVERITAKGGDLSKEDEDEFKAKIKTDALPGTPPAPSRTYAYLDKRLKMLVVASSADGADDFITFLTKTIGGCPFILLGTETDPCINYTKWIGDKKQLGKQFDLGDSCSLKQSQEGGTAIIQVQHDDLEADDIGAMLEAGKQCCRISLECEDAAFAVTADLGLRAVALADDHLVELEAAETFLGKVEIFSDVVNQILVDLEPLLGGWPEQKMLDLKSEG